ncbi:CCHC-type domain-containing protein [Abeliophyllum distichum]|uniref:CCHC-type domain-containing protein n=1 Tax=Abeliophyllum distichum TaxID=126358 RepID=A0ABD1TZZ1_9LAMI
MPEAPTKEVTPEEVQAYNKHGDDKNTVTCLMLAAMSLELQKQYEGLDAYIIIFHLKELLLSPIQTKERGKFWPLKPLRALRGNQKGLFQKGSKKAKSIGKTIKVDKAKSKSDDPCFHRGNKGHWKKNCKAYITTLKEKKSTEASTS